MFLLYCAGEFGQIAFNPEIIDGLPFGERRYQIVNHFLEVGSLAESDYVASVVASHDAEELCAMPGYRLATPDEQAAYMQAKQNVGRIVEEEQAPDAETPPALTVGTGSKKTLGG